MKTIALFFTIPLVIAILTVAFYYWGISIYPSPFFSDVFYYKELTRGSLIAFFTILGIFLSSFNSRMESSNDEFPPIVATIIQTIKSKSFIISLCSCPIVILFFYRVIQNIDDYLLISLIAFENGYFCKSIVNKKISNAKRSR